MKKIVAGLLSVLMAGMVFTACGKDDSSSKEDKKDTSSAQEAKDTANYKDGDYSKAYTEFVSGDNFTIDVIVTSSFMGETPCIIAKNGESYYQKTNVMGLDTESYVIDGAGYISFADAKVFQKLEDMDLAEMGFDTYQVDDSYKLVDVKDEDGLKVEVFEMKYDVDSEESSEADVVTVSYYFDAVGDIKKIVSSDEFFGDTTVVFNTVETKSDKIELPDFKDWFEMTEDNQATEEVQIRVTLAMFGISEEQLAEKDYTYSDVVEMDDDEVEALLISFGIDTSELFGDDLDLDDDIVSE